MGEAVRDESLHILQHALGLDDYGRSKHNGRRSHSASIPATTDDCYRNRFVISDACDGWDLCQAHVEAGRMTKHGPSQLFGGPTSYCFCVTEAGLAFVREHSPKPPKVSRAKERYLDWLEIADLDPDLTFGQFLKQGCKL